MSPDTPPDLSSAHADRLPDGLGRLRLGSGFSVKQPPAATRSASNSADLDQATRR